MTKQWIACLFVFFSTTLCIAAIQNGPSGNPSVGQTEVRFEVTKIAGINGIQDIVINGINPLDSTLPTETVPGVCLYSSTGMVNVTARTDTTVDSNNQTATLVNERGQATNFRLQLGDLDLFAGNPPAFNTSVVSTDCEDNTGLYSMKVTLSEVPHWAGTYRATVYLSVTAI